MTATATATAPAPLLSLRGIVKEFPGVRALDGVDLEVRAGQVLGLVGENGAGKSTLIKVLGGIYPHPSYQGDIVLDGQVRRFSSAAAASRAGISVVHQELSLVPEMTVAENLLLGAEPRRFGIVDSVKMIALAREMLAPFVSSPGDIDPEVPVGRLGVGVQQIVEIARALGGHRRTAVDAFGREARRWQGARRANTGGIQPTSNAASGDGSRPRPPAGSSGGLLGRLGAGGEQARLVVLDEPTAALTESETRRLFEIVTECKARGTAFIYISHRLEEIFELCDRVAVLRDGQRVAESATADISTEEIVRSMTGKELSELEVAEGTRPGATVLQVEHLSVEHPSLVHRRILSDVSLQVRAGEVVTLAGAMGAGRTALLSTLFGLMRGRVTGRVALDGAEIDLGSPGTAMRQGIALVPEDRKEHGLVLGMSVAENLTLAGLRRVTRHGILDAIREEQVAAERAAELQVKAAAMSTEVATLSGGNQQKVVIGKWLLTEPKLLLLDEPTRGVDVGAKAEIYRLIRELVARGQAVLMASSDLPEVVLLSDRVVVLREGRVAGQLGRGEATQEAILDLAIG